MTGAMQRKSHEGTVTGILDRRIPPPGPAGGCTP